MKPNVVVLQGCRVDDTRDPGNLVVQTNELGLATTNTWDSLNRLTNTAFPDGTTVVRVYDRLDVVGVKDRLNHWTRYSYDAVRQLRNETNANEEVLGFTYNPADELLTLTDGKHQTTRWNYDEYGRVTNKVDAAEREVFRYAYDSLNRLRTMVDATGTNTFTWTDGDQLAGETGPWPSSTVSFTYTNRLRSSLSLQQPGALPWIQTYAYDEFALLTGVTSPAGPFGYQYASIYTALGQTASDLVSELNLPTGARISNSHDDLARVISTALLDPQLSTLNSHQYSYDAASQRTQQVFTAGNYLDYTYDAIGQLKTAKGREPNGPARLHEQYGYAYDAAWNLNYRTNNALIQTFHVNRLNELTNVTRDGTLTVAGVTTSQATDVTVNGQTADVYGDNAFARAGLVLTNAINGFAAVAHNAVGRADTNSVSLYLPGSISLTFDENGNLANDGQRHFGWDGENQLASLTLSNVWRSEFVYDGLGRRRVERGYARLGEGWVLTNETHLVYDGRVILQHRDTNSAPVLTLSRGTDLSSTLQGAGGIGGLLALTRHLRSGQEPLCYHADASGNVTCLINTNLVVVARYRYDPFGGLLAVSGPKATLNPYRFSSKRLHEASGLYDFLYRWYAPVVQRWPNRDPLGDIASLPLMTAGIAPSVESVGRGGMTDGDFVSAWTWANLNLYTGIGNNPLGLFDALGLDCEVSVDGKNVTINIPVTYTGAGAKKEVIDKFNSGIEKTWSGRFGDYNVTTRVTTPKEGGLANAVNVPAVKGRATTSGGNKGNWPAERPAWTAAHEAGHLMGLTDQ
jgi:RHS repeat-associated protein